MRPDDIVTQRFLDERLDQHLERVRKLIEGGPAKAMLSVKDVAQELRVTRKTVERLIAAGELAASKVGMQWRIRRRDVDSYLESTRNRGAD